MRFASLPKRYTPFARRTRHVTDPVNLTVVARLTLRYSLVPDRIDALSVAVRQFVRGE